MKRILLVLFLLSFSGSAFAYWGGQGSFNSEVSYQDAELKGSNNVPDGKAYYFTNRRKGTGSRYGQTYYVYYTDLYVWMKNTPPTSEDVDAAPSTVYDYIYSDAQCQALHGQSSYSTGQPATPDNPEGACQIPPPLSPADEQCQALTSGGANFLTLPTNPGGVFEWSSNGCNYATSSVWLETPYGEWSATYEATGAVDDATPPEEIETTPIVAEGAQDSTSDYTETTDPSTDCYMNNFSYDGKTYCYTPSNGSEIEWGDSTDVGSGGSTGSDGAPLGQGEGDPDGDGVGDSTNGDVIGALSDLGGLIKSGFDGLVDNLTEQVGSAESQVAKAGIDDAMGTVEQDQQGLSDAFDEARSGTGTGAGIGEGSSSPIANPIADAIPDISLGACTDLVFGTEDHSFTISCDGANTISEWLAWILYFWTAVTIIDLFFASRRTA